MDDDAGFRHFEPFEMHQGALGVFIAALSIFAYRRAGKIIALGVALISLLLFMPRCARQMSTRAGSTVEQN